MKFIDEYRDGELTQRLVDELRRLVTLQRAYNHMNAGDEAVEHKDNEAALREYAAAEKLIEGVPDIDKSRLAEMKYWHAVALVTMNRVDESLPLFKQAFARIHGNRGSSKLDDLELNNLIRAILSAFG